MSRSRKPGPPSRGQPESAPRGRDWWSSDPPLTRWLIRNGKGCSDSSPSCSVSSTSEGRWTGCLLLPQQALRFSDTPTGACHVCLPLASHGCGPSPRDSSFCSICSTGNWAPALGYPQTLELRGGAWWGRFQPLPGIQNPGLRAKGPPSKHSPTT